MPLSAGKVTAFVTVTNDDDARVPFIFPESQDTSPDVFSTALTVEKFQAQLTKSALIYVAGLYQHDSVTRSFVQTIIDGHKKFISEGMSTLKKKVQDSLINCNSNEMVEILKMFDSFMSVFDFVDSEHKRIKAFTDCGAYIAPKPYDINTFSNEREISNPDSIVDHVVITPEMLTGQFVPVDLVLKGFLEIDGVLSQILSYMDKLSCDNYVLENIVQGDLWKKKIKPLFGTKIVLPLTLSFDDYEPDNVLGSHAGVHKLGAAYFEISCLPPEFQGALENKFLALLFHSTDRCVGNKAAFRPLLNILKLLESEGITVVTSEGQQLGEHGVNRDEEEAQKEYEVAAEHPSRHVEKVVVAALDRVAIDAERHRADHIRAIADENILKFHLQQRRV
ncbi:hypothetical protein FOCC_FOCC013237 [Frankliniella occidentalis]|nr:hypothetical protein FOCC_FOCC013237 [Frankliniella occidentalis]